MKTAAELGLTQGELDAQVRLSSQIVDELVQEEYFDEQVRVVVWAGEPDENECTLHEFIACNEDFDADELRALRALAVGAELHMGGGAAPICVVRRVS